MDIKRSGSQPSGKGPAEYFTGYVRIDPVFEAKTNNALDIEIGTNRLTRLADLVGFVRFESVKCEPVLVRVESNCSDF